MIRKTTDVVRRDIKGNAYRKQLGHRTTYWFLFIPVYVVTVWREAAG